MRSRLPPAVILLIALTVPLLQWVPTMQGYLSASPPDRVFLGFRYMPGDHFQYAAFVQMARDQGRLLMENPFTTEPQQGVFVLLYFWLLGLSARLTGWGVVATWEVYRFVGGALYILAFWSFSAIWFPERNRRLLATVVFAFAGGLDWIVMLLRAAGLEGLSALALPYDSYWNWSTFGSMTMPNWIWPALGLLAAARLAAGDAKGRGLGTFLLLPCVWFLHPYTGMVGYLAFGLLPLAPVLVELARGRAPSWIRARENLAAAAPGILSFLPVAAYLMWARRDPVFRLNSASGFLWTDHFGLWWYPLAYGLLLPLAWFGLRRMTERPNRATDILVCWLAAALVLSANPVYSGVKFQYLVFPPLAVLSSAGIFHLSERRAWFRKVTASTPLLALCLAGLFLDAPLSLVKDWPRASGQTQLYLSLPEIEAMQWLRKQPDGAVLCRYRTGTLIPWLSGKKVYYGHWYLTLDKRRKRREIARILSPKVPLEAKREILSGTGATYLYYGPREAAGSRLDPALPLEKVYDRDGVTIYHIRGAADLHATRRQHA